MADAYHPQQSVLNPQLEQRQTACMRYISALQRSQSTFSASPAGLAGGRAADWRLVMGETRRSGVRGGVGSDIAGIIAYGSGC